MRRPRTEDRGRTKPDIAVAALKSLHAELKQALSDDEEERRTLSTALLPPARKFGADRIDPARHEPLHEASSMA